MRLDKYTTYTPTANLWKQVLWFYFGDPLVRSRWIFFSGFKVWILRRFGARIGQSVRIKPNVYIKFPWKLNIGDYVWIGENTRFENIAPITVESHVCISQNVYLCTANHNWNDINFNLMTSSIYLEQGSWVAAGSMIGPGVIIGQGAVLTMGSVTSRSLKPMTIYTGHPAQPIKHREFRVSEKPEDIYIKL